MNQIGKKKIIVIGSSGALGQEICIQLRSKKFIAVELNRSNFDFGLSTPELNSLIEQSGASLVINCSAMTGLDKCLQYKGQAFDINGLFPQKLAAASEILSIPVLHFSTESVFACDRPEHLYLETDAATPTTWYGNTKLIGECATLKPKSRYHVFRLPLLYGPTNNKQVVGRLLKKVLIGDDVFVANDVFSTPVYTPAIAEVAVDWCTNQNKYPLIAHLTSGCRLSLHKLVSTIADHFEHKGNVFSSSSSEFKSFENKPLHGGLLSASLDWLPFEQSIARYVAWIKSNHSEFNNVP